MTASASAYPPDLGTRYAWLACPSKAKRVGGGVTTVGPGARVPSTVEDTFGKVTPGNVALPEHPPAAFRKADDLVESIRQAPDKWNPESFRQIIKLFSELAVVCGTCATTASVFRIAYTKANGNHLTPEGVKAASKVLAPDHAAYLRKTVSEGVVLGYYGPRTRVEGMAYQSAKAHINEAYDQIWKEVKAGRVMLFPDDGSEVLSTVVSSSFNRVPKQNTDRTISSEGRFCHDLRFPVNEFTAKEQQPRVVLSTHAEVARAVLRLEARYPGIERALAKRDVKAAFKLIWVHAGDVEVLATDLPGDPILA
jgi:hypothetical protein